MLNYQDWVSEMQYKYHLNSKMNLILSMSASLNPL